MIIILTQPRIIYYAWQIEAALYQNKKIGMDMSKFHVVCGFSHLKDDLSNREDVVEMYKRLEQKYNEVNFFYYEDTRNPINYIPSIIPHLLKKHYAANKWLEQEDVFLTDCDQLWIKKPDYTDLLSDDYRYVSDSRNFINYDYLTYEGSKRPKYIVDELEKLVGLQEGRIKMENDNSGGSHYMIKKVPTEYFEKVERDSEAIYQLILDYNRKNDLEIPGFYGIQAWAGLMFSLLYNLWYFGFETRITDRLAFCWGSDLIERWNQVEILHLAGVVSQTAQSHNLFYKANYTLNLPYHDVMNKEYNEKYACNNYVKILRELALESVL